MSLSFALGNALSGLQATSRMAEVVSANLANALTEGYARRSLDLSAASVAGRGAGVRVDGVARQADRALLAERRGAETAMEGRRATATGLATLESAWGPEGAGIASRIAALESALVGASADPASEPRLALVAQRLGETAGAFATAARAVQDGRAAADADIAAMVATLDDALGGIEGLNRDVAAARAAGRDAAGLLDQRQALVDRVATLVPVREVERPGGAVALYAPGGLALLDDRAARVGFVAAGVVTADQTLAAGGLSGLALDGRPLGPDGVGGLAGGRLGGAFALRDDLLPAQGARLDAVARDLLGRLRDADPTLAPGAPGLLTDAGGLPTAAPGLAGRLRVNPALDGGGAWRIRDGLGAPAPGPAGDATGLAALLDGLAQGRPLLPGGRPLGAAQAAQEAAAGLAARRLAAEEEAGLSAARWSSLKESELAGGVDSDAEMQALLRIEQAYAANARVIATVDAMMKSLLEI